ncbi:PIR Superfamily Protein [Plasmodium ovale curtisi]|uniref:PIR Superfamily Protein n=1 Tax=Plasmodium ovale curtisi TaxID=864141 RepID=A0A1A8WBL0_PLAOA|nr:PIR Superfamily Protein [Plasmodium ovale curtisi]
MITECARESKLPSCIIYEKFSQEDTEISNYNNECDVLQRNLSSYRGIDKLCRKLERNLKDICGKDDKDGFLNYHVQYLHYWLLDKAIQTFSIENPGMYNGIKIQFFRSWKSIIQRLKYETVCEPLSNLYLPRLFKDFNNGKYMYNFYYNYKYFEMKKSLTVNERKESCEHLSSMRKHFAKLNNLCLESPNICSSIFKSSTDSYDPDSLRNQLQCNIYELEITDADPKMTHGSEVIKPSQVAQTNDELKSELGISVNYPETSDSSITVGISFFGLLIISFTLLKFTPIGSWFYNRIIKKGEIGKHLDENENNELSNDYFVTEEIKSQGKGYSISYNSLQNIE